MQAESVLALLKESPTGGESFGVWGVMAPSLGMECVSVMHQSSLQLHLYPFLGIGFPR